MAKGEKLNVMTAALNAVKALMHLKAEDKPAAEKMLADFGVTMDLEKATRAQDLTDAELIRDRWEDGNMHTAVTKEEVKVGPSQESSGAGAEKMIRDYSSPTVQMGTTLLAEKLARLIPPMASSIKSLTSAMEKLAAQNTAQSEAIVALGKALESGSVIGKADDEDEEDEDEKDFKEESEKAARKALKAAKSLVRKAKAAKSDAEDEEDAKACKALKVEARSLLVKAGNELFKARTAAFAAGSAELRKEIRDFAKAEDVEVAEEDEKKEESDKSKIEDTGAKKGNQSDSANADGNQDDSSTAEKAAKAEAEAAETKKALEAALSGMAMLTTDVKGLIEKVAGQSRPAPAVVKAEEVAVAKAAFDGLADKITAMQDSGDLSHSEAYAAREVLGKKDAVMKGILDPRFLSERLSKSPAKVQELFAEAKAA